MDSKTLKTKCHQLYQNILKKVEEHDILRLVSNSIQTILTCEINRTEMSLKKLIDDQEQHKSSTSNGRHKENYASEPDENSNRSLEFFSTLEINSNLTDVKHGISEKQLKPFDDSISDQMQLDGSHTLEGHSTDPVAAIASPQRYSELHDDMDKMLPPDKSIPDQIQFDDLDDKSSERNQRTCSYSNDNVDSEQCSDDFLSDEDNTTINTIGENELAPKLKQNDVSFQEHFDNGSITNLPSEPYLHELPGSSKSNEGIGSENVTMNASNTEFLNASSHEIFNSTDVVHDGPAQENIEYTDTAKCAKILEAPPQKNVEPSDQEQEISLTETGAGKLVGTMNSTNLGSDAASSQLTDDNMLDSSSVLEESKHNPLISSEFEEPNETNSQWSLLPKDEIGLANYDNELRSAMAHLYAETKKSSHLRYKRISSLEVINDSNGQESLILDIQEQVEVETTEMLVETTTSSLNADSLSPSLIYKSKNTVEPTKKRKRSKSVHQIEDDTSDSGISKTQSQNEEGIDNYDDGPEKKRYRSKSMDDRRTCTVVAECSSTTNVIQHRPKSAETIKKRRKTVASKAEMTFSDKQPPRKLNTDREMYQKNPLYETLCILCCQNVRFSVSHYVKEHADHEVLLSRPSPIAANRLRAQANRFEKNGCYIKGVCFMCDEEKCMQRHGWVTHLLTHTGELKYYCSSCDYQAVNKAPHGCGSDNLACVYDDNATDKSLAAFICMDCNYLQISRGKMIKHLKTQHSFDDAVVDAHFQKVTLVPDLTAVTSNLTNDCYKYASSAKVYMCTICLNRSSTAAEFEEHFDELHTATTLYKCFCGEHLHCSETELTGEHIVNHLNYHSVDLYACMICDKVFVDESTIHDHLFNEHLTCEFKYKHVSRISDNRTTVTELCLTNLECNVCKESMEENTFNCVSKHFDENHRHDEVSVVGKWAAKKSIWYYKKHIRTEYSVDEPTTCMF